VINAFAPTQETVDTVREWLVASGISKDRITHSDNKGWLAFDATAEEANTLLHTEYYVYEHSSTGNVMAACDSYHVPHHVQEHLDYVTPGIRLLATRNQNNNRKRANASFGSKKVILPESHAGPDVVGGNSTLTGCDTLVTPACIKALYGIPTISPTTVPNPNNSLGIFEEGDYYAQADLNSFFTKYAPTIPSGKHIFSKYSLLQSNANSSDRHAPNPGCH
jgi:tripeptidyl-peptidase-1